MSGYHQIRPIIKLADGTWLVGDRTDGSPRDWLVSEIFFADLHWLKLDVTRAVTTGTTVEHPDLSRVDQIGFVDLMPAVVTGPEAGRTWRRSRFTPRPSDAESRTDQSSPMSSFQTLGC